MQNHWQLHCPLREVKFNIIKKGEIVRFLLLLLIVFFARCSSFQYSTWSEEDGYIIVQLEEVDASVETYFAEITLGSGSKIAILLGKPDKENKFRIENNFGKFTDVQIYSNKDVP